MGRAIRASCALRVDVSAGVFGRDCCCVWLRVWLCSGQTGPILDRTPATERCTVAALFQRVIGTLDRLITPFGAEAAHDQEPYFVTAMRLSSCPFVDPSFLPQLNGLVTDIAEKWCVRACTQSCGGLGARGASGAER